MTQSEFDQARRQVFQRIESLRRAGVDRMPRPIQGVSAPEIEEEHARPIEPIALANPPKAMPTPLPRPAIIPSLFGEPTLDGPDLPPDERARALDSLRGVVAGCVKCPLLAANRTQTVFGEGSPTARLMFVGEAPGAEEDRTGRPFVGKAGVLLTDMITKGMGLSREEVYIANILKSRPPDNRNPDPAEIAHCLPYLEAQIDVIRPAFLCILGKIAASTLLETALPMSRLRGRWHQYRGIPTIATWHPAYLLRTPSAKKEAWEDLQMLMKRMGLKPPAKGGA